MTINRTLPALAAALLALSATAASAQTSSQAPADGNILGNLLGSLFGNSNQAVETLDNDWSRGNQPLSQRRAALDDRIEAGIRDGSLTRNEGEQLRGEYDQIVRLEQRYMADGQLNNDERADLRGRYVAISRQIGNDRRNDAGFDRDNQWEPLANRRAEFDSRVVAAQRNRTVNRAGAVRLRSDYAALVQLEANYSRNGLDAREQADLRARYDAIDLRMGGTSSQGNRWNSIDTRITADERAGAVSRLEAVRLRSELGDLVRLEAAYAVNGYTADESSYLSRRYAEIDARMRQTRR